jgi:hypothetical protein
MCWPQGVLTDLCLHFPAKGIEQLVFVCFSEEHSLMEAKGLKALLPSKYLEKRVVFLGQKVREHLSCPTWRIILLSFCYLFIISPPPHLMMVPRTQEVLNFKTV